MKNSIEKNQETLVKNTIILGIANICTKGLTFIMAPIFSSWLGREGYGTFDLIITYITLLLPVMTLDCGEALFRFLLDEKKIDEKKYVISNSLFMSIIGSMIVFVVLVIISFFTNNKILLYISFVLLFVQMINNFLMMYLRGIRKLPIYATANIVYMITMIMSAIILVYIYKFGIIGLLISYIIGYILSIIFILIKQPLTNFIDLKTIKGEEIKKILKYSIPLIPNAISWWIMNASDRTIVSINLSVSSNGILAVAHKIPAICETIYSVFHLSWQESASTVIGTKQEDKFFLKNYNYVAVISATVCSLILSLNFIFFKFIFSSEYYPAYYQVPILIVAIYISAMGQFLGGINIARKEVKINGSTTLISAILNVIINLILIKKIGLYATTISTLVSYSVMFLLRYIILRKNYKFNFSKKSILGLLVLTYIFISQYVFEKYLFMQIINIIITGVIFVILNLDIIHNILKKILFKLNKKINN